VTSLNFNVDLCPLSHLH